MSRYVYFDTCALARWAEGDVTTPTLRARHGRAAVQTLLGEAETTLGLSEVTAGVQQRPGTTLASERVSGARSGVG